MAASSFFSSAAATFGLDFAAKLKGDLLADKGILAVHSGEPQVDAELMNSTVKRIIPKKKGWLW